MDETPTPEPTQEPTPEPTIAPDVQDTTYTSSDGAVTIKLPDATWANKSDAEDMISFESPEQGKIRVLHGAASIKRNDHIEPVIHEILCIRFWQWQ